VAADEYVASQVGRAVLEPAARLFLTMVDAARRGEFAATDPALQTVLGCTRRSGSARSFRPPRHSELATAPQAERLLGRAPVRCVRFKVRNSGVYQAMSARGHDGRCWRW
jgi:hypothetical protein